MVRRLIPSPWATNSGLSPASTRFTAAWRNCSFADRESVRASKVFLHFMPHDYKACGLAYEDLSKSLDMPLVEHDHVVEKFSA
jgi:hypothetical protein